MSTEASKKPSAAREPSAAVQTALPAEPRTAVQTATGRFITESLRRSPAQRWQPAATARGDGTAGPATRAAWLWAVIGCVLGLLVGVLLFAPARWLAWGVARASQDRVLLQQAQGSLWRGSARLMLAGGEGSRDAQMLPGRIQWRLSPAWVGARLALTSDCCALQPIEAHLKLGWSRLDLQLGGAPSRWPAELLVGLGTPLNTLAPTGSLALSFNGLRIQRVQGTWRFDGAAQLDANEVSSRLSTLKPLGSYRMNFRGGDVLGVDLSTVSGALQLTGSGQWVGGRLRFRGEAIAGAEHADALANLINIMTRRENGRAVINIG